MFSDGEFVDVRWHRQGFVEPSGLDESFRNLILESFNYDNADIFCGYDS